VYAALTALLLSSCANPRQALTRLYADVAGIGNHIAHAFAPEDDPPPHDIEMIDAGGSYVYLIPADDGVVAIDSGFEADARAVLDALAGRTLHAVLLTHGHIDHTEGAWILDAPTWLGADDIPVLHDERHLTKFASHGAQHLIGSSRPPRDLRPATGGLVLRFPGAELRAVSVPGHTPGSTAWVYRDVAFTGDALVNPSGHGLIPSLGTTEDRGEAWRSFRRLAREAPEVRVLYDAHYGRTDDAPRALRRALDRHLGRARD
jgi:glyoxylase-like metal-dependent hydrolase (beta-lactamase superfamily II)